MRPKKHLAQIIPERLRYNFAEISSLVEAESTSNPDRMLSRADINCLRVVQRTCCT
jgi:hypothetical protein